MNFSYDESAENENVSELRLMDCRLIRDKLEVWSEVSLIMRAYVFIDATQKATRNIIADLRSRSEVVVADVINGPHPVIACLEAENPASMAEVILFGIRKIEGVKDLTVYLSMDGQDIADTAFIDNILPDFSQSITGKMNRHGRKRNKIK